MTATDPIAQRLSQALQANVLPPEGRQMGERLLTRLNQPTRLAVIGLPGAGKSALVNLLLDARLMPDLPGLACIELAYAETARVEIMLADGTLRRGEGVLDPARLPHGALRVTQHLPDPRLKDWSFLELTLPLPGADPAEWLDWMAERSDIAVWCSQAFDDRERRLWSRVPDHLKDHSFLALTRADQLFMKGDLSDRIARLQPVVADEFLALYPVATLQAAAARADGAVANAALWHSSGGKALVEAIRTQIDQSRTASLDHAFILLDRYKVPLEAPAAPPATPPRVAPSAPADTQAILSRALGVLQSCADDLLAAPDPASPAAADRILDRCSTTAETLVRVLSTEGAVADPAIDTLKDDAVEGEQMLMLLRLERGETAAEDSLTVLLQLKKEIAERAVR